MTSLAAVADIDVPVRLVVCAGFGDVRFTERTRNSALFVNPLMAIYFTVDLPGLARRLLYPRELGDTKTQYEVRAVIESFRDRVDRRERRTIPH